VRRALFGLAALLVLGGCIDTLQNAYDERARDQCEQDNRPRERGGCLDRADQARRDRDRD
jgi:hypothetical protein